ncbi:MAG: hypothetical protein R3A10_05580 [Caldilineaceae bacterium]
MRRSSQLDLSDQRRRTRSVRHAAPDGGNNFCQISNSRVGCADREEGVTIVNPEDRKPIYDRIQEIFVEEVPVLYLQFDQWLIPFSREVEGLPEDPATSTE